MNKSTTSLYHKAWKKWKRNPIFPSKKPKQTKYLKRKYKHGRINNGNLL